MIDETGSISHAQAFMRANGEWVRDLPLGTLHVRRRRQLAILTCMDSGYTPRGCSG